MASYVDSTLISGERVICRTHVSMWPLFPIFLISTLILAAGIGLAITRWAYLMESTTELVVVLGVIGIGLIFFLGTYVRYTTSEFAVTDRRIIAKTGLLSRRTIEMFLDKVETLNIDQGVVGRMLNYGTVTIHGSGSTAETFRNVSNPLMLRKEFMGAADGYRKKA